ncbi:MAG: MOSC domain-containing protein [Halieaceae bacterium]|jgi:uncharacterized protein YcbX|nr:MOSC domain-containing protein [Halieaceae bacterium]
MGTVTEIWRYAVKSMGGERLQDTTVGPGGVPGDRAWAVRDEVRGGIRGGKKLPGLMQCKAAYPNPPAETGSSPAQITLPDGSVVDTGATDVNERLSAALDHAVSLWPLLPADALDHYRRGAPDQEDFEQELRDMFGRQPDEPLPDLSLFPPELMEFESPPGTYFDAFPILLLSNTSLATLRAASDAVIDVRRFRPNFLLDLPDTEGYPEQDWHDRRLQLGEAVLQVTVECPRCVMTTHGFDDLPRDPGIMRSLVQSAGGSLGVYATVEQPGTVKVGDALTLLD